MDEGLPQNQGVTRSTAGRSAGLRPEPAAPSQPKAAATNAEQIGRAMSDANKRHILTHQREMTFRELGEVAAQTIARYYCSYCDAGREQAPGYSCPECGNPLRGRWHERLSLHG